MWISSVGNNKGVIQIKIELDGTLLTSEEHEQIIRKDLIPKILKVIEESEISCHEAATVPLELEVAIEANLVRQMGSTKFEAQPSLE